MKIILSLSLLFISCIVCKGQYFRVSDSSGVIIIGTNETIDSAWLAKEKKLGRQYTIGEVTYLRDSTKYYYRHEKPIQDTIIKKIVYQYSDIASITQWIYNDEFIKKLPDSTNWRYLSSTQYIKDTLYLYDHSVRWAYGYLVIVSDIHSSLEHYLDADKQPLYKNIIVWKYIEIE